jgi:hypothetical protein
MGILGGNSHRKNGDQLRLGFTERISPLAVKATAFREIISRRRKRCQDLAAQVKYLENMLKTRGTK